MMKDSQPVVIIAPPTNSRARAASRSAGVSGHCGALGAVITILFIKGWAGWARKFTTWGYTGPVRGEAVMPPACDPVFRTSVPMMVMRGRSFRQSRNSIAADLLTRHLYPGVGP